MPIATIEQFGKHCVDIVPFLRPVLSDMEIEELLQDVLDDTCARLEEELETRWDKTVIRQSPLKPGETETCDIRERPFDYYSTMLQTKHLPRITLRRRPIISIEAVSLQFHEGPMVLDVPSGWLNIAHKTGSISIIPVGSAALIAGDARSWFLPLIGSRMGYLNIPQFVCVDYTAGWVDEDATMAPPGLGGVRRGVLNTARYELLQRVMGLIPVGGNVDGASQNYASMETRLESAKDEAQAFIRWWDQNMRPPRLIML